MQSDVFGLYGFEGMDSSMGNKFNFAATIGKYFENEAFYRDDAGQNEKWDDYLISWMKNKQQTTNFILQLQSFSSVLDTILPTSSYSEPPNDFDLPQQQC